VKTPRIVVAGAGPVGLAFACACNNSEVTLLDAAPARPAATDEFDLRIFALSAGTRTFLRDIGAWEHLDSRRVAPVRRMEVFGDQGAKLSFSGRSSAPLAWIVEAGRLSQALEAQAATLSQVRLRHDANAIAFEASAEGACVHLESGERVEGDLLVGADGPDSRVRAALELETSTEPYAESAIVANFEVEKEHGDVARQWFRADGVLAWLPLPGQRISIVWSAPEAVAAELAALDALALERRVRDAGGATLGELRLISKVASFPLRLIRVERTVAPGVALIGDAAHAVHPLAGQGVNLGFQDARVLADELGARSPLERPGDLRLLRRYARTRREDVSAMQFVTDKLDQLFSEPGARASWLRNAGLRIVDSQPWAKDALATRAMR
jgi:ubiquinone biosynthesis UbiH/UbiF/VisC/COQ6 family hydroxylase